MDCVRFDTGFVDIATGAGLSDFYVTVCFLKGIVAGLSSCQCFPEAGV